MRGWKITEVEAAARDFRAAAQFLSEATKLIDYGMNVDEACQALLERGWPQDLPPAVDAIVERLIERLEARARP